MPTIDRQQHLRVNMYQSLYHLLSTAQRAIYHLQARSANLQRSDLTSNLHSTAPLYGTPLRLLFRCEGVNVLILLAQSPER